MANTRTIAFARVSSKAQEDEGYSLDAQLKLVRNYCKANKLMVVSEFRISETASKNEQRSVFRQMLQYITKHNVAHLVVEKTDRLTRNMRDAVVVDDWLDKNDQRRLHMVKENLIIHKHAKSDAKLMWNIYLAFAKKYTDNLREEAMKGWSEKLEQGWMPAPPPPGYITVIENSKKIHVINEETAPVVERAFKLYLEPGQSVLTVTGELAQCGLTSRKGKPLSRSAVHSMLRNPFYIGIIRFNKQEYVGAQEPLIDNETFNAVQKKLGEHQGGQRHHSPLFKGMLRCDECGTLVTWQLQKGRYYGACQRNIAQCKKRSFFREDRLEDLAREALKAIDDADSNRDILTAMKQKLAQSRQPYVGQHRLHVMELIGRQLHRNEVIMDNIYEDKVANLITEEAYISKRASVEKRITELQERLSRLKAIEGASRPRQVSFRSILNLYDSEPKTGKRLILASLFKMTRVDGRIQIEDIWSNKQKPPSSDIIGG